MSTTHEIEGRKVSVKEVVDERHYTLLFTKKPHDSEVQRLQSRLESIGIHCVKELTSCDDSQDKKGKL